MRSIVVLLSGLLLVVQARGAPEVIAHRGASGYLPEHTLAAYAVAYAQGADLIEPDLVLTRDGVLVARHEPRLDETTDVAERFPERRAADGSFYAADLTWAETATLRTTEYREGRFPAEARLFPVPRFEDVIALVAGLNAVTGCSVGLYPELKATAWHRERGLDPVAALRAVLADVPFEGELRIQSFEASPLEELAADPIPGTTLVQLVGDPAVVEPVRLEAVARYADGLGPAIQHLARARENGDDIVARAHALGLTVDTWTLRADDPGAFEDFAAAAAFVVDLGVDGIFTDHPDQLAAALGRDREITPCDR
ncbi:MAG: glycerophosphodiester phosphodiesterase family protein [Pseudomonadales bacterium]|jgi:glycerophosphoryl diester phosphodiesterase|nr:glycerophosphodiester phosphodiesterase family protein [Pseudomonadales bacterium]